MAHSVNESCSCIRRSFQEILCRQIKVSLKPAWLLLNSWVPTHPLSSRRFPMAFLRNRTINLLNLHSGGQALAQGMGGLFVLVFLLRARVSVPACLCAMALIFAGRFVTRPVVLIFA